MWGISTIAEKLTKARLTTVIPVVFICAAVFAQLFSSGQSANQAFGREQGPLGGPEALAATVEVADGAAMVAPEIRLSGLPVATDQEEVAGFAMFDAALVLEGSTGTGLPDRDGLLVYKVKSGDTLSHIAANFGINLDTIVSANPGVVSRLKIGQELVILPVAGILHVVAEGDTLDGIAARYDVGASEIIAANPELTLAPSSRIIIPGAKISKATLGATEKSLPNLNSYFKTPTTGWNWGKVHGNNGVDMANACGTGILAAAEGLVVDVESPANWNGGYGGLVEIEHPNGTKTRYAHTQKNLVAPGDYVNQGDRIADMGQTGNATGCHLHFEVVGARNPLAR